MVLRSRASFSRCTFAGNVAAGAKCSGKNQTLAYGRGTVMVATTNSTVGQHYASATFDDCVFRNNYATSQGVGASAAAIGIQQADVNITNCRFFHNSLQNSVEPLLDKKRIHPKVRGPYNTPSYEMSYGAAIMIYNGQGVKKVRVSHSAAFSSDVSFSADRFRIVPSRTTLRLGVLSGAVVARLRFAIPISI